MTRSPHKIFRDEAIQHSLKQHERQNLARFVPFPMLICLWVLIAIVLITGYIAWNTQIPTYINGNGIIISQKISSVSPAKNKKKTTSTIATAAIFLPADKRATIHSGQRILLTIEGKQGTLLCTVQQIATQTMSPQTINQRYGQGRILVTQPSLAVFTALPTLDPTTYEESGITAQIETGSQKILSMLTGWGS